MSKTIQSIIFQEKNSRLFKKKKLNRPSFVFDEFTIHDVVQTKKLEDDYLLVTHVIFCFY